MTSVFESRRKDLNLRPTLYESVALPTELRWHEFAGHQFPEDGSSQITGGTLASIAPRGKIWEPQVLFTPELRRGGKLFIVRRLLAVGLVGIPSVELASARIPPQI